ncbi:MAG: lytic transglycosylase domain-containing protein [Gammaproteobacteria bacterium]
MQVMPFWKRELGRNEDNLIKVDTNVRYGTAILAYYLENAQGDLVRALAGYNGSDGQLDYPDRVLKALRQRWQMDLTENVPALLHSCRAYSLASCTP